LRRERDDGSGNAGHDDTGQRHRRRGHAGRIACIAIGLLRRPRAAANYKTVFNGAAYLSSLCLFRRPNRACPGGGVEMAAERTAHATS
jgi:hypothetical protein